MNVPRLALWLVERSLAPDEREAIVGDLVEEYYRIAHTDPAAARRWVWSQTVRSAGPNLYRRLSLATPVDIAPRRARSMNGLVTDLRFAVRLLLRQPMMTIVGLLSLAAGLGLNVLLLTLANSVLLRPLALRDPGRLVLVLLQRDSGVNHNLSYPAYVELRDRTPSMESLVAYAQAQATAASGNGSELLDGEVVSGNFFSAMGVSLRAGRGLIPEDDRPSAPAAVVISEQLWRDRFNRGPLAGQSITLNGDTYAVVGVAADEFRGMEVGRAASFWIPLAKSPAIVGGDYLSRPTASWLTVVGRLQPSVSAQAARDELDAELQAIFRSLGRTPEAVLLRPGARGDSSLPERIGSPLLMLMAAGVLVLLIASANVANLQLARTESRRLEIAVRAALGARHLQLLRLMMLDGALLAAIACLVAFGLAALMKDRAASLIAFYGQPVTLSIPIDWHVVLSGVALTFIAAAIIGSLSAWQILVRPPASDLADGRTMTRSRRSLHRGLVVLQFALSMALLTGAGLLVRSLDRLRTTDLGYESSRVALVAVSPEMGRLPRADVAAYYDAAIQEARALPGVMQASIAHVMPLDFGGSRMTVDIAGYVPRPGEDMEFNFLRVTPGYFETMGIPIRRGRAFDDRDRAGQPIRIVVNETMARRFWRDGQAVGSFVRFTSRAPYDVEVIGVVPDVHYRMVREERGPSFYLALAQDGSARGVLHVRYAADPAARIEELRRTIAAVNTAVPVTRAVTLRAQMERNLSDDRMARAIAVALAAVALTLAAGGLYATMAFVVGRRTREIGVRLALGARTDDLRRMVLREGLELVALGGMMGLGLAIWVGYSLRSQLYGTSAADPASLVGATTVLGLAALLATWIPARRATRVDPVVALREP